MLPPNSITVTGTLHGSDGPQHVTWLVPEEIPVAIMFNSSPYAVMMATPENLADFAKGFALAEGLVGHVSDIKNVLILHNEDGLTLDLAVDPAALNPERMVKRSLEGRVGCGLCGIEDIQDAIRMPQQVLAAPILSAPSITLAYDMLPAFQPMNRLNRTVHAAAWCSVQGDILTVREDVGRHNALDKLIGALAVRDTDFSQGFVLMSSRCSFELVQKCALAGIGALATISAPTALALRLARQAGIQLAALSRGGVMIFDQEVL